MSDNNEDFTCLYKEKRVKVYWESLDYSYRVLIEFTNGKQETVKLIDLERLFE